MNRVWVVVRREYLERVGTKGFILSTIAVPLLMLGLMALSIFMGLRAEQSGRELALIDFTGRLHEPIAERMEDVGYSVEIIDPATGTEALDRRVLDDEIRAYMVLDDLTAEEGTFLYRGKESPGRVRSGLIRGIVVETVLETRLSFTEDVGGVRELLGGGQLEFEAVGEEQSDAARTSSLITGIVGAILLYMTMLIYGAYVLRSVLDEKRNRVVEVVISSIRPWQLMLGKILGVGSMGLTQLGIWASFGALLLFLGLPMVAANWPAAEAAVQIVEFLPSAGAVLLFLAFFLLGYFLYSALFAAVGAMCSREEDAQQAQFPVVMLLGIPFIMHMSTIQGGRVVWMEWAALFPFFSPILMYPRAVAGTVPLWMVALSLVLMGLAIVATAWVAGRIYRVGILMQGKRPTLRQLVRWVRAA